MATNFTVTVNKTGEDYGSISSAEAALQADLTSAATKVFSHGGITGTVTDGSTVTGQTSAATGVVCHCTATQIMLKTISGTFQSGEEFRRTVGNSVTSTNAGDSVKPVISCYDDDGELTNQWTIDGSTTDATNFITLTVPVGDRHPGTDASGFRVKVTSDFAGDAFNVADNYTVVEWCRFFQSGVTNATVVNVSASECHIRHCVITAQADGTTKIPLNLSSGAVTNYAYRNFVFGSGCSSGIRTGGFDAHACFVYNNTVIGTGSIGIDVVGGTSLDTVKNNLVLNTAGACYNYAGGTTKSNNGGSDTSGEIDSLVLASETVSATDCHLITGATSIDAGVNLGSPYDTDIDNTAVTGTWDIGADEFVAIAGGVSSVRLERRQPRGELRGVMRGAL